MTPGELARRLAGTPAGAGLVLDFDGTLTPIVADPATSHPLPGVARSLTVLARGLGLVAVVSGRPVAFLQERVAVPGVVLLGLYGLEAATAGQVTRHPELAAWQEAVDRAKGALEAELGGHDGVHVEDKGHSVAVHWRRSPDRQAAGLLVQVAADGVAAANGLAVEPGKLVAELRPPIAWDKGTAVETLADDHGVAELAYVGDDLGDLPAFRAVRRRGGTAVGVDHGAETPAELRTAVDVLLPAPEGVAAWLRELAGVLP